MDKRHLEDIPNPRLINPRYTIVHVTGVKHQYSDATSGHPTGKEDHMETASTGEEEDLLSKVARAGLSLTRQTQQHWARPWLPSPSPACRRTGTQPSPP